MASYHWTCTCCGRQHDELPTCWDFGPPVSYHAVPAAAVDERVEMDADLCVIDGTQAFVRGHMEIPIIATPDLLIFNVWTSLSKDSLSRMIDTWDDPARDRQPPYFGWLNTEVPVYPGSLNLATNVSNRAPGVVPFVILEPSDHPLSLAQRQGVTLQRVVEIAEALLPPH